jgi:hypothetical protein
MNTTKVCSKNVLVSSNQNFDKHPLFNPIHINSTSNWFQNWYNEVWLKHWNNLSTYSPLPMRGDLHSQIPSN